LNKGSVVHNSYLYPEVSNSRFLPMRVLILTLGFMLMLNTSSAKFILVETKDNDHQKLERLNGHDYGSDYNVAGIDFSKDIDPDYLARKDDAAGIDFAKDTDNASGNDYAAAMDSVQDTDNASGNDYAAAGECENRIDCLLNGVCAAGIPWCNCQCENGVCVDTRHRDPSQWFTSKFLDENLHKPDGLKGFVNRGGYRISARGGQDF